MIRAQYAGEFRPADPGARAEVLPKACHMPQLERLDAVGPIVAKFLRS